MLPNHSPLVIAEQFGTLESLYPGRIDLGLGRAPGTDQLTARALRRDPAERRPLPPRRAGPAGATSRRRAGPGDPGGPRRGPRGAALDPRLEHVRRAARGRCSACRTRSPRTSRRPTCSTALALYRSEFRPSAQLAAPYAMAGVNVIRRRHRRGGAAALHDAAAGVREPLPRQARAATRRRSTTSRRYWSPPEKAQASRDARRYSVVGSPETVRAGLEQFVELHRGRRADGRLGDLRPRRAPAVVRDPRRG